MRMLCVLAQRWRVALALVLRSEAAESGSESPGQQGKAALRSFRPCMDSFGSPASLANSPAAPTTCLGLATRSCALLKLKCQSSISSDLELVLGPMHRPIRLSGCFQLRGEHPALGFLAKSSKAYHLVGQVIRSLASHLQVMPQALLPDKLRIQKKIAEGG